MKLRYLILFFLLPVLVLNVSAAYTLGDDTSIGTIDVSGSGGGLSQTYIDLPRGYMIAEANTLEQGEVSVTALDPITAEDATGLKAIVLELLGDYSAIEVEFEYQNTNGYSSYIREIQPDYPWLVSAGIFAIVLYCLIRMGVAMLCKQ